MNKEKYISLRLVKDFISRFTHIQSYNEYDKFTANANEMISIESIKVLIELFILNNISGYVINELEKLINQKLEKFGNLTDDNYKNEN